MTQYQIEIRRDTAANFTSVNPVLGPGEPGYETDTGKLKFGDGSTGWNGRPYFPVATGIPPLSGMRLVGANKVGALVYTGTGAASGNRYEQSTVVAVSPGDQMTLSGYIDATAVTSGTVDWEVDNAAASVAYASFTMAAGQAGWASSTFTVPAGVTQVTVLPYTANATVANGGKLVFACPRLELGPYANPFNAPGNLVPDPGFLNGITSWPTAGAGGIPAVAPGSVPGQFVAPSGPPASGTWQKDDQSTDETGKLYICTRGGTVGGNLLSAQDSEFEGAGVGSWVGTGATVANSTAQAHSGSHCLAVTATTNSPVAATAVGGIPVSPNVPHLLTAYLRGATTTGPIQVGVDFYNAAGTKLTNGSLPAVSVTTTGWTRVSGEILAPASAVTADVWQWNTSSPAIGDVQYIDTVSLTPDVTWRRPGDEPRLLVPGGEATFDPRLNTASIAGAGFSGFAIFGAWIATRSETVSQITMGTGGAGYTGGTPTLCRMGLYWVDPVNLTAYLIGSTANDTTLFAAGSTRYTRSLTIPVAKVAGQRYAAAAIVVTAGVTPQYQGVVGTWQAPAKPLPGFFYGPGGSDLPTTATASQQSFNNPPYAEVTP